MICCPNPAKGLFGTCSGWLGANTVSHLAKHLGHWQADSCPPQASAIVPAICTSAQLEMRPFCPNGWQASGTVGFMQIKHQSDWLGCAVSEESGLQSGGMSKQIHGLPWGQTQSHPVPHLLLAPPQLPQSGRHPWTASLSPHTFHLPKPPAQCVHVESDTDQNLLLACRLQSPAVTRQLRCASTHVALHVCA